MQRQQKPNQILSKTGAMPNLSWSQAAGPRYCGGYKSGPGSVCNSCYAGQGHFRFGVVKDANYWRYRWFHDTPRKQVVAVLSGQYMLQTYARVFISGDFCHVRCVGVWTDIVKLCPETKWWFPTRAWLRSEYHPALRKLNSLPNVVVRLSNEKIGEPVPYEVRKRLGIRTRSTVYDDKALACPKQIQKTSCDKAGCFKCWSTKYTDITYALHGHKVNWKRHHNGRNSKTDEAG